MKLFTKNVFRNIALAMLGSAALSACSGAGSCANCSTTPISPSGTPPTVTIEAVQNPIGDVMMGNAFQFKAMISVAGTSTVTAAFVNPAAGVITSDPSTCSLDLAGTTNCTFTAITKWDTTLANSLSNLAYQISITATNSATIAGNPFNYTEITPTVYLPQTGEQGSSGVAWPSPRFSAGSGAEADCITDNLTGLMWPKNGIIGFEETNGGGPIAQPNYVNTTVNLNNMTWAYANTAIDNLNRAGTLLCGHTDWYLPTVNDLASLLNDGQANSDTWLNGQGFSNVQAFVYWSSSTLASYTSAVWFVNFNSGLVQADYKTSGSNYVWPVRLAQ